MKLFYYLCIEIIDILLSLVSPIKFHFPNYSLDHGSSFRFLYGFCFHNNIGNYAFNYSILVDCERNLHTTYAVMPLLQVMVPFNYTEFIDGLTMLVKKRIITMSRIDDAVRRILRVKFVMGLFENPFADRSLANQLGRQVSL